MGGERASKTRQRERGQICCMCGHLLDSMPWGRLGERYCPKCEPTKRIYMSFFNGPHGWRCGFLEPDLRTSVCRGRVFATPDKVRELIVRTPTHLSLEDQQAFDYGIGMGRGGVYLTLTGEQYRKLKG